MINNKTTENMNLIGLNFKHKISSFNFTEL